MSIFLLFNSCQEGFLEIECSQLFYLNPPSSNVLNTHFIRLFTKIPSNGVKRRNVNTGVAFTGSRTKFSSFFGYICIYLISSKTFLEIGINFFLVMVTIQGKPKLNLNYKGLDQRWVKYKKITPGVPLCSNSFCIFLVLWDDSDEFFMPVFICTLWWLGRLHRLIWLEMKLGCFL